MRNKNRTVTSPSRCRMAAICAFETFERRLVSTSSCHWKVTTVDVAVGKAAVRNPY